MKRWIKYSPDEPDEWELPGVLSVRSCHHRSDLATSEVCRCEQTSVWSSTEVQRSTCFRRLRLGPVTLRLKSADVRDLTAASVPLSVVPGRMKQTCAGFRFIDLLLHFDLREKGSTSSALGSPSAFWSTTMRRPVPLHRKASISVPNAIWLSHEWKRLEKKKKKKKNRPVSRATFRPHIHQKHQD